MNLKISRYGKGWSADCLDLPGSPSIGTGRTKAEAVACLFFRLISDRDHYLDLRILTQDSTLKINDKLWKDFGSKR